MPAGIVSVPAVAHVVVPLVHTEPVLAPVTSAALLGHAHAPLLHTAHELLWARKKNMGLKNINFKTNMGVIS